MDAVEALIIANVLCFIITLVNPEFILDNFALIPVEILEKPWGIVTSMFLHAGFNHILFNMIALFFFGLYLKRVIGENEFLKVYLIGGICSGIFTVITSFIGLTDLNISVVGASGAIFAVGATLAILRPNLQVVLFPIPIPMPLYIAVFGFMLILSFMPGISWSGHLGGLLTGMIFGYYFKRKGLGLESYGVYSWYRY